MAIDSEDAIGWLIGAVVLIGGGIWLNNHYEIKKRGPERSVVPVIASTPPAIPRPNGIMEIASTKSGSRWTLDAESVSGPRKARQGWVTVDSSKDKAEALRTTKTLYLVDCDTTAARTLSEATYKVSDHPVTTESHDPKDAKIEYYPPTTLGGAVVRSLCNKGFGP